MSEPTIQLSLSAYDEMRNRARVLTDQITLLEGQLLAAKVAPPEIQDFLAAVRAAFEIVRFAVANCPVENVRNWPHAALAGFADVLPKLPGFDDQATREAAFILKDRAREIAEYEAGRSAVAIELRKAITEGLPNGLICPTCGKPQYAKSGGAQCRDGHAVSGKLPEEPAEYDLLAEAFEALTPTA